MAAVETMSMNTGELLKFLVSQAKSYAPLALKSVAMNDHMNALGPDTQPSLPQVEAVVVDFINFVGTRCGVDMGLYTCDLTIPHEAPTP